MNLSDHTAAPYTHIEIVDAHVFVDDYLLTYLGTTDVMSGMFGGTCHNPSLLDLWTSSVYAEIEFVPC